jgi:hypothetical protein
LRIGIDLPYVPPELFEQAFDDDDADIVLARKRELFSYFRASVETKEEAEKLAFALAAAIFPAFRPRSLDPATPRGRRRAARPKYEVEFLRQIAEAYDNKKSQVKSESTTTVARIYKLFLKENPELAAQLQVKGAPLTVGSFQKLLTVGRMARDFNVIWHKGKVPYSLNRSGEYVAINPIVAGVYEGLRHVEISLFSEATAKRILTLDPTSTETKREINYYHDLTVKLLLRQAQMGVKSRVQKSSRLPIDPLALMRRNGKFKDIN